MSDGAGKQTRSSRGVRRGRGDKNADFSNASLEGSIAI